MTNTNEPAPTTAPEPVPESRQAAQQRAVACGRAIEAALAEHRCTIAIRPQVVPVGDDGTIQVRPVWGVFPA